MYENLLESVPVLKALEVCCYTPVDDFISSYNFFHSIVNVLLSLLCWVLDVQSNLY
jgi:hypothetical protein